MQRLNRGLRTDETAINQPDGSWRNARNIVVRKSTNTISNEDGADNVTPINFPINPVNGCIITPTDKIFFFASANGDPLGSEIGIVNFNNIYTCIVKDNQNLINNILNFNINFPIQGTFENKYNNNRIIAWGDRGYNPPRILNIDCLPFNIIETGSGIDNVIYLDQQKAKNLLNLFPTYETPILTDVDVKDAQGSLITGAYYPIIAYELIDGSVTSWSKPYNGIPIYVDSQYFKFEQIGGDIGGKPTSKSIELTFSDVDLNYSFLHIGYVSVVNGITSASYCNKYPISNTTGGSSGIDTIMIVEILGNESTFHSLVLNDVLVPNAVYDGNYTITNVQGKLMLGNITEPETIDLQPFANEIQVNWIKEKNIPITGFAKTIIVNGKPSLGSYKDGKIVVFDKNFKSGECYALYITARLKYGGVYTQAFHIPGRPTDDYTFGGFSDRSNINDLYHGTDEDLSAIVGGSGIDVPLFQIQDTTSQNSSSNYNQGKMGYWENKDEKYPLDPKDPTNTNIHPDYANIPGNRDISGNFHQFIYKADRQVRHHVFPDLKSIKQYTPGSGIDMLNPDFITLEAGLQNGELIVGSDNNYMPSSGIQTTVLHQSSIHSGDYSFDYPVNYISSSGISAFAFNLYFNHPSSGYNTGATVMSNELNCTLAGILKINFTFVISQWFNGQRMYRNSGGGGSPNHFPAEWETPNFNGGSPNFHYMKFIFTIYKNGTLLTLPGGSDHYEATIGVTQNISYPDNHDWSFVAANKFRNNFINVSISPGDTIDIMYRVLYDDTSNSPDSTTNPTAFRFIDCFGATLDLQFSSSSVDVQPLGLVFSNINIPQKYLDKIDAIEFLYAKRTNTNIRIVAQDTIKEARFHNFDLLSTKAMTGIDYLKPLLRYTDGSGLQISDIINNIGINVVETGYVSSPAYANKILKIYSSLYIGEHTLLYTQDGTIDNTNKATSLYINAGYTANQSIIDPQNVLDDYQEDNTLFDLCIYKTNVYFPFNKQELVTTGYCFKLDTTNPTTITRPNINGGVSLPVFKMDNLKVYGGDTYINAYGFVDYTSLATPTNADTPIFYMVCESISNIGLRYQDLTTTPKQVYYPKGGSSPPSAIYHSVYNYNTDYNCINIFNQLPIFYTSGDCESDKITNFPYRIAMSIVDSTESKLLNWRIFKANSYYDMPKNKGVIINLLGENKELYIQHLYSLYLAQIRDELNTGTIVTYLGFTDFFDRPPIEIQPVNEGYAGSQSQFAIILCKLGYCFIDKQMGKIFIYKLNQSLTEISNKGQYHFFKDNLEYLSSLDNPFLGEGYTIAYDEQMDRLIIVKNIKIEERDSPYRSFTISYSPNLNQTDKGEFIGGWIGFHDYIPNYILFNRSGLYGIDNTQHKLFKHNSKLNKAIFYSGGSGVDSYVEPIIKLSEIESKRFDNFKWLTNVDSGSGLDYEDKTLTNLMVYNNNQCSGIISLTQSNNLWFGHDVRNVEGMWNFNDFRDNVISQNVIIIDNWGTINNSNININKAWFEKSEFISKFVVCRLIYNNLDQHNIHIIGIDSNVVKSNRG